MFVQVISPQYTYSFDKTYVFYIILGIIAVFILLTTPKRKIPNKKQIDLYYEYDNYVNEINLTIDEYKLKFNEVHDRCMEYNNVNAFSYLKNCSEEFPIIFENTENISKEILKNFDKNNYKKAQVQIRQLAHAIVDLQDLIEKLSIAETIVKNEYEQNQYNKSNRTEKIRTSMESIYFSNCNDKESLEKRYKMLAKAFHPDAGFGDEESFKKMQEEYEQKLKEMSN